jgi:hypothetical protein
MNPYKDLRKEDLIIREFSENIDPTELKWHRDLKNREIKIIGESDWLIQLENELPQKISSCFIPQKVWHRVIKGGGKLVLQIREWD